MFIKINEFMRNYYCKNCEQTVGAKIEMGIKEILITVLLFFCLVIPAGIYFIYIYKSPKFRTCPICMGKNFEITERK